MTTNDEQSERTTRQFRLGLVVLVLAIFSSVQAVYFTLEARDQRECLANSFGELTDALNVRITNSQDRQALVAERERLDQSEQLATTELILSVRTVSNSADFAKKLQEFVTAIQEVRDDRAELDKKITALDEKQGKVKLPPFPEGKCSSG